MTTPQEPFYLENPSIPDWSVVRFSFESEYIPEPENDNGSAESLEEPLKTLRELIEENEEHLRQKVCSLCKQSLPLSSFSKDAHVACGYRARCKKCTQDVSDKKASYERLKKSRAKNPEKTKARNRRHSRTFSEKHPERRAELSRTWKANNWVKCRIYRCKERAQEKGIPFDMSESDLLDKATNALPTFCPIFPHIKLDYDSGPDRRCWASVDKIVPALGYTSGNVWVVSMAANWWKNNGSNPAERERIVAIMQGQKKKQEPNLAQPSLFDDL